MLARVRPPSHWSFFRDLLLRHSPRAYRSPRSPSPRRHDDVFWWNSAITAFFRHGEVDRARDYFDRMPRKNLVTWNCMIAGFIRNGMLGDARRTFDVMSRKNVMSWTVLLTGYAKCGRIEEARRLFNGAPERNVVCWNSMISGYLRNGMIGRARELFDEMPSRNNVSWSIIISGYLKNKLVAEARALFDQAPIHSTSVCNALLSGYVELGRTDDAEDLFDQMPERDIVTWNTMITCYSRAGKMELAERLFQQMPEKDIVSWTAVMHGYLQNGNVKDAQRVFQMMPDRDVVAWNTMMGGFVQNGMLEKALILFEEMPERDVVSWNTILQGYVQHNDMAGANCWFQKMPERSETSWNTLISGYKNDEALALFRKMVREGFFPDQATLSIVISVCASLVALGWGKMLHLYAIRSCYQHDALVMSSVIAMYSRCGLIDDATRVFDCIVKLDTIAWNAIIGAYAYHGFAIEAFKHFNKMTRKGFIPDQATFLSILLACVHKGLVDEGCQYFRCMQEDWNLVPKPEHYSCMVDLLGRAGLVTHAYDLTQEIPVNLQTTAWETLLSACRVHGNLEIGEVAAERVLHAQPADGGMHTLLSNIYAEKGMWSNAESVRVSMKDQGLKKETGCSWIEVKGKMCSFLSNQKLDPLMEETCRGLDNLSLIMKVMS